MALINIANDCISRCQCRINCLCLCSLFLIFFYEQELAKAVNGDGKAAPTPLIKVNVVLEGLGVIFEPSYDFIVQMIVRLAATVTSSLDKLLRVPAVLNRGQTADLPYRITIESDEEIKKLRQLIVHGLQSNAPNLQVHIFMHFYMIVYGCICMFMVVYICICIYGCIYMYMYVYIWLYMCVCMHVCGEIPICKEN